MDSLLRYSEIVDKNYATHTKKLKITPFEALYGRPYYLPPFQQSVGVDDEMTIAELMIKTLQHKEVLRANDLLENLFSPQETDDLVTEGDCVGKAPPKEKVE